MVERREREPQRACHIAVQSIVVLQVVPPVELYDPPWVASCTGADGKFRVEYMPWANRLFKEMPKIVDGKIEVPSRPGLGLEFDEKVCAEYEA